MAKYIVFQGTGAPVVHCASNAEKAEHEAVDSACLRTRTYVSVNDTDYEKIDLQKNLCEYDGSTIVWDSVDNDGTIDLNKESIQGEIDFTVERISNWLNSRNADHVSASVVTEWTNYKNELQAIDLDTKTFPMQGTYWLRDLVGNGITAWKNTDRLP